MEQGDLISVEEKITGFLDTRYVEAFCSQMEQSGWAHYSISWFSVEHNHEANTCPNSYMYLKLIQVVLVPLWLLIHLFCFYSTAFTLPDPFSILYLLQHHYLLLTFLLIVGWKYFLMNIFNLFYSFAVSVLELKVTSMRHIFQVSRL